MGLVTGVQLRQRRDIRHSLEQGAILSLVAVRTYLSPEPVEALPSVWNTKSSMHLGELHSTCSNLALYCRCQSFIFISGRTSSMRVFVCFAGIRFESEVLGRERRCPLGTTQFLGPCFITVLGAHLSRTQIWRHFAPRTCLSLFQPLDIFDLVGESFASDNRSFATMI